MKGGITISVSNISLTVDLNSIDRDTGSSNGTAVNGKRLMPKGEALAKPL